MRKTCDRCGAEVESPLRTLCKKCWHELEDELGYPRTPYVTNADRIRSMTDEELAEWFAGHDAGLVANVLNNDYVEPTKDGWLEWLETGV